MDPITIALIITSISTLTTTLLLPICLSVGFCLKNIKKSSCCGSNIELRKNPILAPLKK